MRSRVLLLAFILAPLAAYAAESSAVPQQPAPLTSPEERAALHNSPDWALIQPHLPDPKTATVAQLETAGDAVAGHGGTRSFFVRVGLTSGRFR